MADYPLDKNAVKKIRANIVAGNREHARSYYFLDDETLKAIEENQLFPEVQPDICLDCKKGVIVFSISSCQSCYHCSNNCGFRGCANGARIKDTHFVTLPTGAAQLGASMIALILQELRAELGLDPFNAEYDDALNAIRALKEKVVDKKDTQIAEQSRLIAELIRRLTCEHCGAALDEGPGPGCIDEHPAFQKKQEGN